MFEYVSEKKVLSKEEVKGKVITAVLTLAFAAGLFTALYWVASGG